jgi:ATP-binding cassette, subfamily B, bacterial
MLAHLRRTLPLLRPYATPISLVFLLALLGSAMGAALPLLVKRLVDDLSSAAPSTQVAGAVAGLLGLQVFNRVAAAGQGWLSGWLRVRLKRDLMDVSVRRLLRLPVGFHASAGSGGRLNRLNGGVDSVAVTFLDLGAHAIPTLAYLVIAVVLMVELDARLALLVVAFAPLPALIGVWAAREQTGRDRDLRDRWTRIFSRFGEALSGVATLKAFGAETTEAERFLTELRDADGVVVRGMTRDTWTVNLQGLVSDLATASVWGLGAVLVLAGEASLGTLVAFTGYVGALFGPVSGLTGKYQMVRRAAVGLESIYEVLDADESPLDPARPLPLPEPRGHIRFEGVFFAYPGAPGDVLSEIELEARPGETVAIVGPSGAGKTTILNLVQRFHDPVRGAVTLDGVDLRDLAQESLRRHLGVVMQDVLLFDESVGANIRYGAPCASDAEVEAAARAANAHDFICRLPAGYETRVGERGQLLSAGQRQRLAIARALLRDPLVLLLDEPTSSLDAESEHLVQEALAGLSRGRTTFVVAHRLSTIRAADRIVVLRDGRIVEVGPHDELVHAGGPYARFHALQSAAPAGMV